MNEHKEIIKNIIETEKKMNKVIIRLNRMEKIFIDLKNLTKRKSNVIFVSEIEKMIEKYKNVD